MNEGRGLPSGGLLGPITLDPESQGADLILAPSHACLASKERLLSEILGSSLGSSVCEYVEAK